MNRMIVPVLTAAVIASLLAIRALAQNDHAPPANHPAHAHAANAESHPLPDSYAAAIVEIDARLLNIEALIKGNAVVNIHPEAEAIAGIARSLARLALMPDSGVPKEAVKEINLTAKALAATFDAIDKAGDSGDVAGARTVYEEMVGLQATLRKRAPATPPAAGERAHDSYFCPMHCEGAKTYDAPGKCPECGMTLKKLTSDTYSVQLAPTGGGIEPGKPITLKFALKDPMGAPVTRLETVHEKILHLLMVSKDLSWYSHEHPELQPDATFTLQFTFPRAGDYVLFYDFTPLGVGQQVVQTPLTVESAPPAPVALSPDSGRPKTIEGYSISLDTHGPVTTGGETRLTCTITRDGAPVTDLQPYLGAMGHLVIISQDLKNFVHSHPHEEGVAHSGPQVEFAAHFQNPGLYKGWAQFKHNGTVFTAPFTFEVKQADKSTPAPPHEHNHPG